MVILIHHKILGIVTLSYLVLFIVHLFYFATRKERVISFIWIILAITFGLHTTGLILRWIESYNFSMGHAPLTNFYESLIVYAWSISLIMFVLKKRLVYPVITAGLCLIAFGFMAYASLSPSVVRTIQPLIPALQSNWLHIHVITCFLAYAAFAVSFICSILFLILRKDNVTSHESLEEINYTSIIIGFPMLIAGILTGAVWAHYAWGSYWSWDPKETWSLITWLTYALILHARLMKGWRGKRIAFLSICGFISVIFTYFGVNFILTGLHSYAT